MTVDIRAPLTGYRFAETRYGDTVQSIALRELGDGKRWPELVAINSLVPPYITTDPALVRAGVVLAGSMILIPAATAAAMTTDQDLVFERDIDLSGGDLQTKNGDFVVVSGLGNLRQSLRHRLDTEQGELSMHPEYGSRIRRLVGQVNGATAGLLAAEYAKAAVAADPRIRSVRSATADVQGDSIRVSVVAEPVTGRAVDVGISV